MDEFIFKFFSKISTWALAFLDRVIRPIDAPVSRAISTVRSCVFGRLPARNAAALRAVEATSIALMGWYCVPAAPKVLGSFVCVFRNILAEAGLANLVCGGGGTNSALLDFLLTGAVAVLAYFFARWALILVSEIASSSAEVASAPPRSTRALIMGLSPLTRPTPATLDPSVRLDPEEAKKQALEEARKESEDNNGRLADFLKPGQGRSGTAWKQNARRIAESVKTLEAIYVLPSRESQEQFEEFNTYCRSLFGNQLKDGLKLELVKGDDGTPFSYLDADISGDNSQDYESYDYVSKGLIAGIKQAERDLQQPKKLQRAEICIDVTAGFKIFSIAAGVVTLNEEMQFSYVTTVGEKSGTVRFYDASVTFPGRLGKALKELSS